MRQDYLTKVNMLACKLKKLLNINIPLLQSVNVEAIKTLGSWIWFDIILRYRKVITATVLASYGQFLSQVAALALVFAYANSFEVDRSLTVFGYSIPIRTSLLLLIATALIGFLLLVISAFLAYKSKTNSLKLRRLYEEFCFKRFFVLVSRLPHPATSNLNRLLAEKDLLREGKLEAKFCGQLLELLLTLTVPLTTLVVFIIVLFYLSVLFSSLIVIFSIISLFFLYRINVKAAETSLLTEQYSPKATSEKRNLLKRIFELAPPIDYANRFLTDIFAVGKVRNHRDVFFGRYILEEKTRLVINIMTAISILAIILIAGMGILFGKWSWSILLAYLVSLRYFLTSLMQVGRIITKMSRKYPQIKRYYEFVEEANIAPIQRVQQYTKSDISLSIPSLENNNEEVVILKPGMKVLLAHPGSVDRRLVTLFYNRTIIENDGQFPLYWFIGDVQCEGNTLRESFGFPEDLTNNKFAMDIRSFLPEEDMEVLNIVGLDSTITNENIDMITQQTISVIRLLAAIYSKRPVILIKEENLSTLFQINAKAFREAVSDRIVIVARDDNKSFLNGIDDLKTVIISNGSELIGWCSTEWLAKNPEILISQNKSSQDYHSYDEWDDEDEV